ncbi:MAG: 3-phosphoshikimate 1-carboxyvinyltransferase [Bacteroidales bacterium]|jgi:3-phosphoshikimate 1-carboxyvinyltransferase|nr:3-phosphoshikimate 1-carboxyvinyltransferase [Bacteroidales bacterium]
MTSFQLTPSQKIDATIALSTSKSVCNRALIIAALCDDKVKLKNISDSDDSRLLSAALNSTASLFDIGAAGTAMRFLTAYLTQKEGEWSITGSERMKQRPIGVLVDALRQLGADISYAENKGYPPLNIKGKKLRGGALTLKSNISSQFISAILMIAPTLQEGLTLTLEGEIISRPYIQMTLDLMAYFGVKSQWKDHTITIPEKTYAAESFDVEIDWSGASYWYEVVSFNPQAKILLKDAQAVSYQGDAEVQNIFTGLGVKTTFIKEGALLQNTGETVDFFEWDLLNQPDLAQTVVTTCAMLNIPFKISGLQTLRIKETDRIAALINELSKFGIAIHESDPGTLAWNGETCDKAEKISITTYEDHRMALAFAPTAILHPNISIEEPEVVSKSYPGYWDDMKRIGFKINA